MAAEMLHGRFELRAPLGSGGVATVWRAADRAQGGVEVALKVLHPHLRSDPVVRERFRREVEIGRSVKHPAIVRTHELFEDEKAMSFSLELLEGQTLKEVILVRGPLPLDEVLRICRRCLEGLGAAHAAGVIHRDFKPQNVFLCRTDEVKILDFGFARVASAAGLTTRSLVLCTPDYAAPEVVSGRAVDGRTDLYALGVVLFEALTGKLPFQGATPFDLLQQHISAPAPDVRALRNDTPESLARLVGKLMEKSPEARFSTCEAALAALEVPPSVSLASRPPAGVCGSCGEPREPGWPLCPACGATGSGQSSGDKMVVLVRAPPRGEHALAEVLASVGAKPSPLLARKSPKAVRDLPRVVLKGVGDALARLVRERAQARELQVEIRSFSDNNSDLLYRSNTPGYLFALALVVPWALASGAALWFYLARGLWTGSPLWLLLPALPAFGGPLAGIALLKKAHRLLPALGKLEQVTSAASIPAQLARGYAEALRKVTAPNLRGTLRRLFERALIVYEASTSGPAHVQMLLQESGASALELAEKGLALAEAAQDAQDRLARLGEADLLAELEALRTKIAADPAGAEQLRPILKTKEATLAELANVECTQVALTQKLLRVASVLELASVQALLAGMPAAAGLSLELKRLIDETETAVEAAREIAAAERLA